jgi:glycerate kinase
MMSRVVLAPDKFKGCLTAAEVAAALGRGITAVRPTAELVMVPVADGGDGTVAAALTAGYREIVVDAVGPTGDPLTASYALLDDRAVVELAAVVGLDRLPRGELFPLASSTYGLGLVIADAIAQGARSVILGLGGSASTDGGAGMVQALGARLLDEDGSDVGPGGGLLGTIATLDLGPLRAAFGETTIMVATDVDNPLLGPNGAAAIFGPQKGADASALAILERGLAHWAELVAEATGTDHVTTPGAGAAGGTGFGALALLGAEIRPGIELVLEMTDFARRVTDADLVITGEGSLDEQSLSGKAPIGVATAAGRAGVRVVAVAGRTELTDERLQAAGIAAAYPLSALEPDVARSIANAAELLDQVGRHIGKEWLHD